MKIFRFLNYKEKTPKQANANNTIKIISIKISPLVNLYSPKNFIYESPYKIKLIKLYVIINNKKTKIGFDNKVIYLLIK